MRGRYQGGSLAGFIIIGVVLTLVLVGGLYGLNRYNAEQSKEVAIEEDKNSGNNQENGSKDESSSEPQTGNSDEQSSDESSKDSQNGTSANDKSGQSSSGSASNDKQLPATGPADAAAATVAVVALSFATVHYLRSRAYRNKLQ